jgi:hypothetical protein
MSSHHISTKRMKLEKSSLFVNPFEYVHYFLKILFINHTYKIQTKQGKSVAYPLAEKFDPVTLTFDFENQ